MRSNCQRLPGAASARLGFELAAAQHLERLRVEVGSSSRRHSGSSAAKRRSYSRTSASHRVGRRDPVDGGLHLATVRRVAAAGLGIVGATHLDDLAARRSSRRPCRSRSTPSAAAPRGRARAGSTSAGALAKVVLLDPELARERNPCASPSIGSSGLLTASSSSTRPAGPVLDHDPERPQHAP